MNRDARIRILTDSVLRVFETRERWHTANEQVCGGDPHVNPDVELLDHRAAIVLALHNATDLIQDIVQDPN